MKSIYKCKCEANIAQNKGVMDGLGLKWRMITGNDSETKKQKKKPREKAKKKGELSTHQSERLKLDW